MQCLCKSGKDYDSCCKPIIMGDKKAETAEQLMRARYTAYAQKEMDFISSSHDPKTRSANDMKANKEWANKTTWLGLEIVATELGGPDDDTGVVEFKAKYDAGEGEQWHSELSQFTKRSGVWYFTDSKGPEAETFVREGSKVGRNDPCPCGSGKKYKKCCGKN